MSPSALTLYPPPTILGPYDEASIRNESVRIADLDGDDLPDLVAHGDVIGTQGHLEFIY